MRISTHAGEALALYARTSERAQRYVYYAVGLPPLLLDVERAGERVLLRERNEIIRHLEGAESDHPCGLIKIGVSAQPRQRATEIRGRLLAVEPDQAGTLEEERHEQFASERVSGEWFRPSIRLLLHIAEVAELERERAVEWRRAGWTLADELRALAGVEVEAA